MTVKEFFKIKRDYVKAIHELRQQKGLPALSNDKAIETALAFAYGEKFNVKKISRAEIIEGFERYIKMLKI